MARDGVFPGWLGRLSRRNTPVNAHITSSGLVTIMLLLNYTRSMEQLFTFVALLATTASLFTYLACCLAAFRLAQKSVIAIGPAVLCAIAIAGLYALWALYGAGISAVGWGIVLILLGVPVHVIVRCRAPLRVDRMMENRELNKPPLA